MRKVLVALVAALLVGTPVPASADPYDFPHCPDGVARVRNDHPWADHEIDAALSTSAARHGVPAAVLKALAWAASGWKQFLPDGTPTHGTDTSCPLGILRVPAAGRDSREAVKLANNTGYNVDEGARLLRAHWDETQQAPPPTGYAADDADVLENWHDAICLYGGCAAGDDAFARAVGHALHDPFVAVPPALQRFLRPAGFTLPGDAHVAYAYPAAFQARDGELVFYDAATGTVTAVVPARTHRASAPPVVAYPVRAFGPDSLNGPQPPVTCGGCAGWRLAEGSGLSGRAHWTTTVTTAPQTSVRWQTARPGNSRVQVWVPALGTTPLGVATYRVDPGDGSGRTYTVTVDQNARKGSWVTLGDWFMSAESSVSLDNRSATAGQTIVADAVRLLWVPVIAITGYRRSADGGFYDAGELRYGQSAFLWLQFNDGGYNALPGQRLKVYRRTLGTTAWQMIGTWTTDANAEIELALKPAAGVEFVAKWVTTNPAEQTDGTSRVHRFTVRPIATIEIPNTFIDVGRSVVAHARVTPAHAGQTVYLQRFYSGAWRTVQARTLSTYGTATFTYAFAARPATTHHFRVLKPADRDHLVAVSDWRTVGING